MGGLFQRLKVQSQKINHTAKLLDQVSHAKITAEQAAFIYFQIYLLATQLLAEITVFHLAWLPFIRKSIERAKAQVASYYNAPPDSFNDIVPLEIGCSDDMRPRNTVPNHYYFNNIEAQNFQAFVREGKLLLANSLLHMPRKHAIIPPDNFFVISLSGEIHIFNTVIRNDVDAEGEHSIFPRSFDKNNNGVLFAGNLVVNNGVITEISCTLGDQNQYLPTLKNIAMMLCTLNNSGIDIRDIQLSYTDKTKTVTHIKGGKFLLMHYDLLKCSATNLTQTQLALDFEKKEATSMRGMPVTCQEFKDLKIAYEKQLVKTTSLEEYFADYFMDTRKWHLLTTVIDNAGADSRIGFKDEEFKQHLDHKMKAKGLKFTLQSLLTPVNRPFPESNYCHLNATDILTALQKYILTSRWTMDVVNFGGCYFSLFSASKSVPRHVLAMLLEIDKLKIAGSNADTLLENVLSIGVTAAKTCSPFRANKTQNFYDRFSDYSLVDFLVKNHYLAEPAPRVVHSL